MKYYVTADVHGFYTLLYNALTDAGFFEDPEPHKLIILGDLFDRGEEAKMMQDFILRLMEEDQVILIRGNHEDLYVTLVTEDDGKAYSHHVHNGTFDTGLQLTGFDRVMAKIRHWIFAAAARKTPYYQRIIPAMLDHYETEHYIFVHGWIPCIYERGTYSYYSDWRNAPRDEWDKTRWSNGMEAADSCMEKKTIVCGHWHASYGHSKYEHKGSEFGPDADFSPYYGSRIIAMDACTAISGKVNVIILED
ncbi:MAG: metallophosphoesterase [Oscillospiraceae bacterium]|nr:metallophosphoesterase [Oscillospiraceae bacterium]